MLPQGRARPTLAKLYNWRYEDLGDLPYVTTAPEFLRANPGFAHDFQFIDVPDYHGRGESEPVPHFYQVLASHCPCISSYLTLTMSAPSLAFSRLVEGLQGVCCPLFCILASKCKQSFSAMACRLLALVSGLKTACLQNLGEAEYLVSLYQYMRLRGYPADKISILTTYNGQKALIRDVVERRCAGHPAFGRPLKASLLSCLSPCCRQMTREVWCAWLRCTADISPDSLPAASGTHGIALHTVPLMSQCVRDAGAQVTTVDKYQGQQNEYVLLSLVRTRAVGHVRDVRRLVVAMSRARLGLYIFGRLPLFANCYELQPTMAQLMQRPTQLALQPTEYWQVS